MEELDKLMQEREKNVQKLYIVLFQVIAAMVVPGAFAAFVGNFLKNNFDTSSFLTLVLVATSLLVSLLYVSKIYKRLDIEMTQIDTKIKNMREVLGIPTKKFTQEEYKENN